MHCLVIFTILTNSYTPSSQNHGYGKWPKLSLLKNHDCQRKKTPSEWTISWTNSVPLTKITSLSGRDTLCNALRLMKMVEDQISRWDEGMKYLPPKAMYMIGRLFRFITTFSRLVAYYDIQQRYDENTYDTPIHKTSWDLLFQQWKKPWLVGLYRGLY